MYQNCDISETTWKYSFAIVGTSGSGKSTLLHMIGGLDVPTEGRITVDNKQLEHLSDDELTVFRRRKIGFIFQHYNLVPVLSVWENIVLPLKLDGQKVDKDYIIEIMKMLGIDKKGKSTPSERFEQTIVMITHNEEIAQMADRIIHIEDGRIVEG